MGLQQEGRALCTDQYELTMAGAYFELGMTGRAAFELTVRDLPPNRGYLVCAGIEQALSFLKNFRFTGDQIDYLRRQPLLQKLSDDFWDYLAALEFSGTVTAVPEGRLVFADEPLLRVEAPLIEAQLVETFLLAMVNYQTLIATKAARVVSAARRDGKKRLVVDFGSRRAHGPEAGVLAARAGYVGGCDGTSNVEAGHRLAIPISGTEAHSFVMSFDSEEEAFKSYYEVYGEDSILLIDTYDVIEGAKKAIRVAPEMKGVRIDSGDLAKLSKQVRQMLEEAGLEEASIVASGDLDEYRIHELLEQEAPIDGFGVGTRLVTGGDAPYLGGVYKLVSVERNSRWKPRLKLSSGKELYPGMKSVFRFHDAETDQFTHDLLAAVEEECPSGAEPVHEVVLRGGAAVRETPPLEQIRDRARAELERLPRRHRRLREPDQYPVRISETLKNRFESISEKIQEGAYE